MAFTCRTHAAPTEIVVTVRTIDLETAAFLVHQDLAPWALPYYSLTNQLLHPSSLLPLCSLTSASMPFFLALNTSPCMALRTLHLAPALEPAINGGSTLRIRTPN